MLAIAYYLLKVVICSAILYSYYRLTLHNKIFHAWNRFYLLSAVVISLLVPLIKIDIHQTQQQEPGNVIRLLNVVSSSDAMVEEASGQSYFSLTTEQVIAFLYLFMSVCFLGWMGKTIIALYRLTLQSQVHNIQNIHLVDTDAKGTPFSFFRYIFWNRNIDPESANGKRIFKHELVHVKEKHSFDRVFMNLVLSFFWFNPFFWLIRKEMNMIHEFIADSKSVEDSDTSSFAAMILQAAYPQHSFGLTSNFFTSSIKRRLYMLTKMKNKKVSYLTRIMVLPLLTLVFMAFALKVKKHEPAPIPLQKTITVVVDAGHGGTDDGAKSETGIKEKDIALALANRVAALNKNPQIKIVLTRSTDVFNNVREKVDFALQQQPTVFISLHVNNGTSFTHTGKGFEIFLSQRDSTSLTAQDARLVASLLTSEIEKNYPIQKEIKRRQEKGIWVLDAQQINYPSILLQCGYMSDSRDMDFMTKTDNQDKIARNILTAIERYASLKEKPTALIYDDKKDSGITHMEALFVTFEKSTDTKKKEQLMIVNGKEVSQDYLDNKQVYGENGMVNATIYKENNKTAINKYGEKARNGAFILENAVLRDAAPMPEKNTDTIPRKIKSVDVTVNNEVIVMYDDGKAEKMSKEEAVRKKLLVDAGMPGVSSGKNILGITQLPDALYLLDGKEITREELNTINPDNIKTIDVIKGESAVTQYGEKARKGVIQLTSKTTKPEKVEDEKL